MYKQVKLWLRVLSSACTGIALSGEKNAAKSDAFDRLVKLKVNSIQRVTNCEKARNIQEAIAENLKYFLKEVGKREPLFRVSELIQVGSFAEGTKINKPDEFDFVAVIEELSKEGTVVIKHDPGLSDGCVTVLLADKYVNTPLKGLLEDGQLKCVQAPSLAHSFTGPVRFGTTFVKTVESTYKKKVFPFRKSGMFSVMSPVNIDFVGGGLVLPPVNGISLLLSKVEFKTPNVLLEYKFEGMFIRYNNIEDCISSDKCSIPKLNEMIEKHGSVLLVGNKNGGFRVAVTECEVEYMQKIIKKRHKHLYVLLKYMCYRFTNEVITEPFSSYMLKQVCLQHDAKCRMKTKPLSACLGLIIEDMITYCAERMLPSGFDKDVNLFNVFRSVEARDWHLKLHFLIALKELHNISEMNSSVEDFEVVMENVVEKSAKKFKDFHKTLPIISVPWDKLSSWFINLNDNLNCPVCDTSGSVILSRI